MKTNARILLALLVAGSATGPAWGSVSKQAVIDWFAPILGEYALKGDAGCEAVTLAVPEHSAGYASVYLGNGADKKEVASWIGEGSNTTLDDTSLKQDFTAGGIDSPFFRNVNEFAKDSDGKLVAFHLRSYQDENGGGLGGFFGFHKWKLVRDVSCHE